VLAEAAAARQAAVASEQQLESVMKQLSALQGRTSVSGWLAGWLAGEPHSSAGQRLALQQRTLMSALHGG